MKNIYLLAFMGLFWDTYAQEKFTVYFDTARDAPTTESAEAFEKWLAENKTAELQEINAYTDSIGKPEDNFDLSKRRLMYVNGRLGASGIKAKQIKSRAYGETKSQTGALEENRRVDIYYVIPKPQPEEKSTELQKSVIAAKKGDKLVLENLNFYGDSGTVLPESEHVLQELLTIMRTNEKLEIEIQGHICCHPEDDKNISFKRAKSVYDYLIANGISKWRLNMRAFGSSRPKHPLPERNARQQRENRRVEIEIVSN